MPLINGYKYSCEPCIRGHRATSCAHTDRILIEVRKPGRPLESCGHSLDNCTCGKVDELLGIATRSNSTQEGGNYLAVTSSSLSPSSKPKKRVVKGQPKTGKRPKKKESPATSPQVNRGYGDTSATSEDDSISPEPAHSLGYSSSSSSHQSYMPLSPINSPPYHAIQPLMAPQRSPQYTYQQPGPSYTVSPQTMKTAYLPTTQISQTTEYAGRIEDFMMGLHSSSQQMGHQQMGQIEGEEPAYSQYIMATQNSSWTSPRE